ncbi:hypothetical protein [Paraburkholderia tropica]|uniref:hypothetical protein n=1 Tax=Paraburkholderia tropica TaxID=92647 RepID=UPI003D2C634B
MSNLSSGKQMANQFGWEFVHSAHDVLFNMMFGDTKLHVHVTLDALVNALGSSGSVSQNENAIAANIDQISAIALSKAKAGEGPHLEITQADLAA